MELQELIAFPEKETMINKSCNFKSYQMTDKL